VLPPGGTALEGRAVILEWARGWASNAEVEIEVDTTIDEVQVMGDWAFVRMTIARTIRRPDQDPRSDIVKTIQVHRRQPDGSWKIARDIWNSHPRQD
jgi:ketosteroid isomerase-like protein